MSPPSDKDLVRRVQRLQRRVTSLETGVTKARPHPKWGGIAPDPDPDPDPDPVYETTYYSSAYLSVGMTNFGTGWLQSEFPLWEEKPFTTGVTDSPGKFNFPFGCQVAASYNHDIDGDIIIVSWEGPGEGDFMRHVFGGYSLSAGGAGFPETDDRAWFGPVTSPKPDVMPQVSLSEIVVLGGAPDPPFLGSVLSQSMVPAGGPPDNCYVMGLDGNVFDEHGWRVSPDATENIDHGVMLLRQESSPYAPVPAGDWERVPEVPLFEMIHDPTSGGSSTGVARFKLLEPPAPTPHLTEFIDYHTFTMGLQHHLGFMFIRWTLRKEIVEVTP